MKDTNNLINYDEKILDNNEVKILKLSALIGIVISIILIVLILSKTINYQILIGYIIGIIVSCLLFIKIVKTVKHTNYLLYKNKIRKNYSINLLIYTLTLIILYLITKNPFSLISCVGGIVTNKLAIYIYYLKGESK